MSDVESIYAYILENPGCRNREISAALKIPMGTVNATVHTLRKQGNVKPAVVDSHSPSFGRCWAEDLAPSLEPSPAPHPGAVPADTGEAGGGDGVDVPPLPTEPDSPTATLDALCAAKELAEENAGLKAQIQQMDADASIFRYEHDRLRAERDELRMESKAARKFLESERLRANAAEDELAEVQWLCSALGFQGSADTEDLLQWLLEALGRLDLRNALLARRRILADISRMQKELKTVESLIRPVLETGDLCKCGEEATKLESEDGFTTCDSCYHQDGEE